MVSSTKQTEARRMINLSRSGRSRKRKASQTTTPAFPIHPDGYDPKAADAKKKSS